MVKWIIDFNDFKIPLLPKTSIKGKALADFIEYNAGKGIVDQI